MFGFMKHSQPIINHFLGQIFNYLEPVTTWKRRRPFKP